MNEVSRLVGVYSVRQMSSTITLMNDWLTDNPETTYLAENLTYSIYLHYMIRPVLRNAARLCQLYSSNPGRTFLLPLTKSLIDKAW